MVYRWLGSTSHHRHSPTRHSLDTAIDQSVLFLQPSVNSPRAVLTSGVRTRRGTYMLAGVYAAMHRAPSNHLQLIREVHEDECDDSREWSRVSENCVSPCSSKALKLSETEVLTGRNSYYMYVQSEYVPRTLTQYR
nr:MAG: hypothetical protein AM324_01830 [Candidatus Thorarchaeota archaeon SMTZ1-83]